ncbi:MAG TPA: hypothetical protein PKK43_00080 [Spirochaetota bacterium]|nr:hypothetical protein [Spirochaetota bacterium]
MISFEKVNAVNEKEPSVFQKTKDEKKSLLQTEAENAIPKSAMINKNEPGKGTKIDTMA